MPVAVTDTTGGKDQHALLVHPLFL